MARRDTIVIVLFIGAVAVIAVLFYVLVSGRGGSVRPSAATITTSKPQGFTCQLTGERIVAKRNPVPFAACIDNIRQARPQSGLDCADIVYEVLAEGGIPRFLAIYSCKDAGRIGPIRSARTYFISLANQFDAVLVHAGGSPEALSEISQNRIRSLNQFSFRKAYFRDPARRAPHNLFTNTSRLVNAARGAGFSGPENPSGPTSGDEQIQGESARGIRVPFPTTIVSYTYDAGTSRYLRSMNGQPHLDAVSGKRLTARNIVIQFVSEAVIDRANRLRVDLIGQGRAIFFIGGKRVEGSWVRERELEAFRYETSSGDVLALHPGQTWVEIVSTGTRVTSTP